jgi:short-subunit dehydrogenase
MKLLAGKQGTSNMAKPGTALITGASSGIGAAYADRLAKRGYDLVLVARSEERLNALAQQVAAACDVEVDVLIADLTSRAEVRLVERRLRSDAAITLLVNNAGIGTPKQVLVEDVDWLEGVLELNVVTVIDLRSQPLRPLRHAAMAGLLTSHRSRLSIPNKSMPPIPPPKRSSST